jgi:uncharacterized protein with PIN domain
VILDTSAIIAITLREPGREELVAKLRAASTLGIGTLTLAEAADHWRPILQFEEDL